MNLETITESENIHRCKRKSTFNDKAHLSTKIKLISLPIQHIVLDLDNTLITSIYNAGEFDENSRMSYYYNRHYVHKRPYLDVFLDYCFEHYDTVNIWSHGTSSWVNSNLTKIIPSKYCDKLGFIHHRDHRGLYEGDKESWHKNMYRIWDEDDYQRKGICPENTIIIDDILENHNLHIDNLIQVKKFIDPFLPDNELIFLMIYLRTLENVTDIRKVDKDNWRDSIK